jgi:hypothetical protein
VTTQDLEDSLSRLAKLMADQPLPDGVNAADRPAPANGQLPPEGST